MKKKLSPLLKPYLNRPCSELPPELVHGDVGPLHQITTAEGFGSAFEAIDGLGAWRNTLGQFLELIWGDR